MEKRSGISPLAFGIALFVQVAILVAVIMFGFLVTRVKAQQPVGKEACIICFTTTWCPNCPSQKALVQKVAKEQKVKLILVDFDQYPAIAKKYGVEAVPTTFVCQVVPGASSPIQPLTKVNGISSEAKMVQYIAEARKP